MVPESERNLRYGSRARLERARKNLEAQGYTEFAEYDTGDPEAPLGLTARRGQPVRLLTGHLLWWSLPKRADMDLAAAEAAAEAAGLPEAMRKRLHGNTPRWAFTCATRLGATGAESKAQPGDPEGSRSYFLTKRTGTDTLIARETLDRNGKRVSLAQCATLWLEDGDRDMKWSVDRRLPGGAAAEVKAMVGRMADEKARLEGKLDAYLVYTVVQEWLERRNRVCLRGTGGVYFVPGGDASELVAVRDWVMAPPIEGSLSILECWTGGANSTEDLAKAATEELTEALAALEAEIDERVKASRPDRALSVKAQITAAQELASKLDALEAVLGEMAPVRAMLDAVAKRAVQAAADSRSAVDMARAAKAQPKRRTLAADPADVPLPAEVEQRITARKNGRKALAAEPAQAEPVTA